MSIKLNLGAGDVPLEGWIAVDRKNGREVFPLKEHEDNSVDAVRASHVLEHFSHRQTVDVVREWVRVLKPGGTLQIAVPDFNKIMQYYQDGTDHRVEGYLFGGHVDDDDKHGAMFNAQKLHDIMRLAGLVGIHHWESELTDCASLPVSLNLAGIKREPIKTLESIVAVLSVPRLSFTDTVTCMMQSLSKLKVQILMQQGVFWGQCLTQAIQQAIDSGAKYVLSIDYDTIFDIQDVCELYQMMVATPDASAICGMQIGRDRDAILMTVRGKDGKNRGEVHRPEIDQELLKIATGHFGLTLFRVEDLKKLTKPWFVHNPDKNGEWGDGRIDEDIYFWQNFERAKLNLYQANFVKLGHLQMVATFPDRNLQPFHQLIGDYRKNGKPLEVM